MPALLHLLTITIPWDPNLAKFGPFTLSWHGVFTAIGIACGVYLGARLGRRQGFTEDDAYSIALVGVPCGIIGARGMFVLENKIRFEGHWIDVLKINEGGITIYGAIMGGILGSVAYGWVRRMPVARGLDCAIFGALLGMAIGRIGDFINGEHIAKVSNLPWAVKYTDPNSPGFAFSASSTGYIARHPATTYEMIGEKPPRPDIGAMLLIELDGPAEQVDHLRHFLRPADERRGLLRQVVGPARLAVQGREGGL